ncbi:hypothetical protein H1P_2140015 [Hyella patelloides LEGE 07179]|uniref:Uncharacterized protein n=1 Tax=Hyella patelloides LEGE 07179 TaxID=945734 RepID=A0A563VQR9_9CYAN|nr:hypothetical protein H1P_2140015 [Hyella patelloides LEGE 07179]
MSSTQLKLAVTKVLIQNSKATTLYGFEQFIVIKNKATICLAIVREMIVILI